MKRKYWSVPRMWDGQTVAILASGPSMSSAVAEKCRRFKTIAINNTFRLAPWADMLYAADALWWTVTKDWKDFHGMRVTCDDTAFPELLQLRHTGPTGFDPDPSCLKTGSNSGYQAIHVAVHAGAKRILLNGYDMRGGHWHGRHVAPLRDHGEGIYVRWLKAFETLKPALHGVEVINCTPGSALKTFPMMSLDEACALPDPVAASLSA